MPEGFWPVPGRVVAEKPNTADTSAVGGAAPKDTSPGRVPTADRPIPSRIGSAEFGKLCASPLPARSGAADAQGRGPVGAGQPPLADRAAPYRAAGARTLARDGSAVPAGADGPRHMSGSAPRPRSTTRYGARSSAGSRRRTTRAAAAQASLAVLRQRLPTPAEALAEPFSAFPSCGSCASSATAAARCAWSTRCMRRGGPADRAEPVVGCPALGPRSRPAGHHRRGALGESSLSQSNRPPRSRRLP